VNSLPKTVTGQRRGCDLNPGPCAPESSTLTTRLPSHPRYLDCVSTNDTHLACCNSAVDQPIMIICGRSVAEIPHPTISRFIFPLPVTDVSALPGET